MKVKFEVPEGGLEPPRLIQPTDFKSVMSTNSITRARKTEASAGFEPANGGFANRSLRPLGYDAKSKLLKNELEINFFYSYINHANRNNNSLTDSIFVFKSFRALF